MEELKEERDRYPGDGSSYLSLAPHYCHYCADFNTTVDAYFSV